MTRLSRFTAALAVAFVVSAVSPSLAAEPAPPEVDRIESLNQVRNNSTDAKVQQDLQKQLRALHETQDAAVRAKFSHLRLPPLAGVANPFGVAAISSILAQAPPETIVPVDTSPRGVFDHFLEAALTPQGIASAIAVVLTGLGLVLGSSAVRKRRVALAFFHAFHIVEDIDNERGDEKLDKVREGLEAADKWMKAHGWRPLKPGEQEAAKLGFQALNGQQALQTKIQADALVASAVASPS